MSALQHLGLDRKRSWYTIGYWAWELPCFPPEWDEAFRYLSEIWAISTFTGKAVRSHPKAPQVEVIGHAIEPPSRMIRTRSKFHLKESDFVFLTFADSMSSLERKNPFSTIRAFRSAFETDTNHQLLVKTRNLKQNSQAYADLNREIGDAPNIMLMDCSLSDQDRWNLLYSVDAIVSLHRSEGFGLTLAEAMAVGKPVICTDWSGNMDFTDSDVAAVVQSRLVPCIDPYGIYQNLDTQWAQADEHEASRLMWRVAHDQNYRTSLATAARIKINRVGSPNAIGCAMAARLHSLIKPIEK